MCSVRVVPVTPTEPRFADAAPELAVHLARVRSRQALVAIQTGAAMAVLALLAWFAIEMPLDWLVELPLWARILFFIGGVGGSAFVLWHFGIRAWLRRPDDDRVALAIERALPDFRSRFISSVQLAREPAEASDSLVRALLRETAEVASTAQFRCVVKTDRLRRWARIGAGAILVAAVLWWIGGKASWPLFQRAWLVQVAVPRKTMFTEITGDRVVALGDDLRIEAGVTGIIPHAGKLRIETAGGRQQEFSFDADAANKARFFRTLRAVQESFRYRVELGDNRSGFHRVRVRPRPGIVSLQCEQIWPAYTKLAPVRRSPGDLKLLAGSQLAVRVKSSSPLRGATLHLVGDVPAKTVKEAPLRAAPKASDEWIGDVEIPPQGVTGMTFHLVDEEGVESRAMAVYRIEVVPDLPPAIRIVLPQRREELITQRATLLLAFEAKDDFGVARVLLHYAVNWHDGTPHKTLDLDLGGEQPKSLTRRFEWKLDHLAPPLAEGDAINFWFEARDANNVTGPGITVLAEHYQARVVSEADKRADLAAQLNDTLRGLNDVRQGEEDLAKRLGEIIHAKPLN